MSAGGNAITVYRFLLAPIAGFVIGLGVGLLVGGGDDDSPLPQTLASPTAPATIIATQPAVPTPVAEATPTPAPTPEPPTHTVEAGDTLSGIAAQYNTTVETLVEINQLASENQLEIGQVLILPNEAAASP